MELAEQQAILRQIAEIEALMAAPLVAPTPAEKPLTPEAIATLLFSTSGLTAESMHLAADLTPDPKPQINVLVFGNPEDAADLDPAGLALLRSGRVPTIHLLGA